MAEVDRAELIRLMVGRELSAVFPKITVPIGDVVLELRESGCQASGVGSINLTVRTGEIVGLAGLVGAGRTELARSIFGLTPFDEGSLWLEGTPVVIDSPATAVRQGIAYVPEDRRRHGVILDMPVSANITLAILKQIAGFGLIHFTAERELADSYVQKFSIKTPSVWSAVGNLSGGNQQKVALARWLVTKPKVIILDEPTQGVDVGAKSEIHKLMGELAAQGLAILMISSELAEVLGMADRIAVMHAGRIVGELPRESATQANVLEMALGNDIDNALQFAPRATPEG